MGRLRVVVTVGLGLAMAACGAEVGRRAATQPAAPQLPAGVTAEETGVATKPSVVVDVDRPWMKWGEARPDNGRGRNRTDPTRFYSDAKVLAIKPAVVATTAAATREAIPKPVEPGSRVERAGMVVEPADVLGK
jgi:hypothetical protein